MSAGVEMMTDAQINAWMAEMRHKVTYRNAQNVD